MSVRSGGHLTLAALRSGMREQYAVRRSYGTVRIELRYDQRTDRLIVTERVDMPDGEHTLRESAHRMLRDAHNTFTAALKRHP